MKKILSLLAVAAMAFTACTTDVTDDVVKNESVEYATPLEFGLALEETKAFMDDETTIEFEDGDFVGVYVTPVDAAAAVTKNAKGTIHLVNGSPRVNVDVASFAPGDKVMVYYPYTTLNNSNEANSISLVINEVQVQPEVGRINCKNMPIVSVATNLEAENGGTILFRPVASIMKLNIYSDDDKYQGATIRRIKFQAEKHENVAGCNYCVGIRKAFDLTTITEDSAIEVPITNASRTTSYDVQVFAYTAYADYNEEGPTVAATSAEANPVYLIFFPGEYGGPKFDSANKSYINIHTDEYGRFDLNINSETPYTFDRAMIRPFNINLANTTNYAGVDVEYIHKNAIEYGTKFNDTGATIGNRANQLLKDELIVIGSGSECPNIARATQTAWNVHDFGTNTRTIYAQTLDGAHGFRFTYYTASQNTLKRGDKLKLQLGGLEIYKTKVADGEWEYWFDKLSPSNIFKLTPGCEDEIVTKEMYINELTAADLNTDIKLLDMEFLVKDAPYVSGNWISENSNIEQFATMMQDKNDDPIYILISSKCTWKRDIVNGTIQVPQGVGSVHGILVHDEDPSYGNMGKFQLRPFDNTSFDMGAEKASAVNEVAAWRLYKKTVKAGQYGWNGKTSGGHNFNKIAEGATTARQNKMCAETNGSVNTNTALYTTNLTAIWSHSSTQIPAGKYVNHTYHPNLVDGSHGIKTPEWGNIAFPLSGGNRDVGHASQSTALLFAHDVKSYYGWNEDGSWDGTTTGIVAEFPGAGKEMSISFTMGTTPISRTEDNNNMKRVDYSTRGTTYGFPLYWKVECSIDGGTSWTPCTCAMTGTQQFKMNTSFRWLNGDYALYDPFDGSTTTWKPCSASEFCPGFIQQKFVLPASAIGAAKVMVKISPATLDLAWYGATWKDSIDQGKKCTSTYSHIHALCIEDVAVTTVK